MPQIYDMGPMALLPLRRKACWGFFRPKNPTASAGFEPANLGTKGQHATSRPPKPINVIWLLIDQPHDYAAPSPNIMSQCPRSLRRGSAGARLLGLWVRIPPRGMDACLLWVLFVVRYSSRRRTDHSSRGVLPIVLCLNVIMNPRQWEGLGPLGVVVPW